MPLQLIISIAAIVITWLVFTWLVKVLKASIAAALSIASIVLGLQLWFGVAPEKLKEEIIELPQTIQQLFQ
jgi:predicted PurR-regulated permease PerM